MKVALCFLVSYQNSLNKEDVWRKWIEPNKDILNIYIHYNPKVPIASPWIGSHIIPKKYIRRTSYYHVVPAYMSILGYAFSRDTENQWFCMLTESCAPLVSPQKFRSMFLSNASQSIFRWKKPWWNPDFHWRANLKHFTEDMRLAHEPWFVLARADVQQCIGYPISNPKIYNLVCKGGLANESIFAIILYQSKRLSQVISEISHIADWEKPSSETSPYVFKNGSPSEMAFLRASIKKNEYALFFRKVAPSFPDTTLSAFIQV